MRWYVSPGGPISVPVLKIHSRLLSAASSNVACFESRSTDPYFNLAFEHYLFRKELRFDHVLFTWRNRNSVVIGRNQNAWQECDLQQMRRSGTPLVRRESGGGAVYHDMGNALFSVIMPRAEFHRDKYLILVQRALANLDISATLNNRHDLLIDGRKVSGSAYKLVNSRAYHHGTMLIETDLRLVSEVLHKTDKRIVSKGVQSVRSSVCNLSEFSPFISYEDFTLALQRVFCEMHSSPNLSCTVVGDSLLERNVTSWDWVYGQNPKFSWEIEREFSFGTLRLVVESSRGKVEAISLANSGFPIREEIESLLSAYVGLQLGTKRETSAAALSSSPSVLAVANWLDGEFLMT